MIYQSRFCHLEYLPPHLPGDKIRRGDKIGRMGNSGKSSASHLHFDLIQSKQKWVYRLKDILKYITDIVALLKQYHYFIYDKNNEMFKTKPFITSYFGDPLYLNHGKFEFHPAYDLVPENRHTKPGENFNIYWPRSKVGEVVSVGFDDAYGFHITIMYEV